MDVDLGACRRFRLDQKGNPGFIYELSAVLHMETVVA